MLADSTRQLGEDVVVSLWLKQVVLVLIPAAHIFLLLDLVWTYAESLYKPISEMLRPLIKSCFVSEVNKQHCAQDIYAYHFDAGGSDLCGRYIHHRDSHDHNSYHQYPCRNDRVFHNTRV